VNLAIVPKSQITMPMEIAVGRTTANPVNIAVFQGSNSVFMFG
jgi:hypothetical protein